MTDKDKKIREALLLDIEGCSEWYCDNGTKKEDIIDWLKRLEWSEEDKMRLEETIELVEANKYHQSRLSAVERSVNWLESLISPPQKQEWERPGKEDQKKIKDLIDHFEYKKEFTEKEDYEILLWLNDLLNWICYKPNKEQLDVLKEAADNHHNVDDSVLLYDLYKNLERINL